jgi:sulfate transport system substrate-binding protein
VLDSGARGATTTFVEREIGDVEIAWENEAFLALREFGADRFKIVVPSISILAEPGVAWVDRNVQRKGTATVARAYLEYLYSEEGQDIIGRNFYRPRNPLIATKYEASFPKLELTSIDDFGGWKAVQQEHFADGAIFDQIYERN